MHMNNALVGKRIKRLRLKNKMTREELAEAANISVSIIYEFETGKTVSQYGRWAEQRKR